jgi:signal transduction histidine kinase
VVSGCVEGYRAAYPQQTFETRVDEGNERVDGSPDLLAQALDKLVANAIGFAVPATPIVVTLGDVAGEALIEVENTGPLLPDGPTERLFDSMVSLRGDDASQGESHLGLGLYVVRLAAQFHRGSASARNRTDGTGVVFAIRLPLAA